MTTIGDALSTFLPGLPIYEARPSSVPATAYLVVSELTDADGREFYPEQSGRRAQQRTLTLLVTLYGVEGWPLAPLRPLFTALKNAVNAVDAHPGLPPIRGVTRGAALPPTPDSDSKRPYCGQRLSLTYVF